MGIFPLCALNPQDVRIMKIALIIALAFGLSEAGFRCETPLIGGDALCSAGCVVVGLGQHTSGICDDEGECHCDQKKIDFRPFRELLPSRCDLGPEFCKRTCNAVGYRSGECVYGKGCECSSDRLSPREFALCAAESTCRIHCQGIFNQKAFGECRGWNCVCLSNDPAEGGEAEYLDFE